MEYYYIMWHDMIWYDTLCEANTEDRPRTDSILNRHWFNPLGLQSVKSKECYEALFPSHTNRNALGFAIAMHEVCHYDKHHRLRFCERGIQRL